MEPPGTGNPISPIDTELTDQYCFSVVVEQEKGTWRSKQTFITFTRYFFSLSSLFQVIICVDILMYQSGCGRLSINLWHIHSWALCDIEK